MTEGAEPHTVGSHNLGPQVVGQRIVVRHLLPDGRATDVLGVCLAWDVDTVVVDRDGFGPVSIDLRSIVTGKPVPPRASVRARVPARSVELHAFANWPEVSRTPLGEWVIRSAPPMGGRPLKRANSVLAMGDPGLPLPEASAAVLEAYAQLGQVPLAQVERDGEVEAQLRDLGWRPLGIGDSATQLASVAQVLRALDGRGRRPTQAGISPLDTRNSGHGADRAVTQWGEGAASAAASLDGDWVCIHSMYVEPARRGQGVAQAMLAELLDWSASLGALTAWLHVESDNAPALALYESVGFRTHHLNRYLTHG